MNAQVHKMFSDIAARYDVTNDVLSLGIHRLWRRAAVHYSAAQMGDCVLDCATGTGDLAMAFKRRVGAKGQVLATDFNAVMLNCAITKAQEAGLAIHFEIADVMRLPYGSHAFDIASIAFGIRNVNTPSLALDELARVVRPQGRVVVLEFGQPKGLFGAAYKPWARHVMPRLGALLTKSRSAYEYLPATAAAFPCGEAFVAKMRETRRFDSIQAYPQLAGLAWVYVGCVG